MSLKYNNTGKAASPCARGAAVALNGHIYNERGLKHQIPIGQSSGKVALDVGVHDRFEVLEFAVLEEVDDVDLEMNKRRQIFSVFLNKED